MEGTWIRVATFVSHETGIPTDKLLLNSRIEEDLGITGGDALELMEKFVDNFGVEYEGFIFGKYFEDEGFDPIGVGRLMQRILGRPKIERSSTPITLGDLVAWAERGYWVDSQNRVGEERV